MKTQKTFLVGISPASFRPHEAAEVLGVESVLPDGESFWLECYLVKYADGKIDHVVISEKSSYTLVREGAIRPTFIQT